MDGGGAPLSVPKIIDAVGGSRGTPDFLETPNGTNTTPGIEQTLLTKTVIADKIIDLHQVILDCVMPGLMRVTLDNAEIGSGRTEAGKPNAFFFWTPARPVAETVVIKVLFLHEVGTQAVNVKAFLQFADVDVLP